ncbi:class I SAM-dependent DNA methyltransferase [Paracoccus albus]|uniref:class I SAM-dependent DNA methyltransferase n=1 Tax=Paracoccus albus TaxID=3017784 RepID=UPI0022F059F1|nr:DNA methyltransferase [Paracoccus albus]WBU61176.1 class I SAM-dependent DNA methyltransferase [Paracoccus albus]
MPITVQEFVERWKDSGGSERANFQRFAVELTQLLGVEEPKLATSDDQNDGYRFERPVDFGPTSMRSHGFIDLYRKGCFILEAKQGAAGKAGSGTNQLPATDNNTPKQARTGHGVRGTRRWDDTMLKARNQADRYARAVAREDGWPPFLLVVDVGHVIEVYADFSGQGQGYSQFPDGNSYRIRLEDLTDETIRARLKTIWQNPLSLDPSLQAARVTREIATHLAALGKSLETQGHDSEAVARFLMRCLFSMFAEDVELIPKHSFTELLEKLRGHPEHAAPSLSGLWQTMNSGGFSQVLMQDLKRFNGGLFADASALPLNDAQLALLIEAAQADWKQVEPAIFGTLLERALDKRQRHKLGAHYTPRSYVERLVTPTIIEPLREDWKDVQTAVQRLTEDGKDGDARNLVHDFHRRLCEIRVLDPACGSGNFLYVALEMMKRLEGEVTALLEELGESQSSLGLSGMTVDPHQFLGIELNPWAAAVSELVLWIGFLQWHFRTHGQAAPSEPVLRDFKNITNADAVLQWTDRTPRMDADGNPVTRWDGVTTIRHAVTGEEVPDPAARVQVYDYAKPKATIWPQVDFIVGNPPFIGASRLRDSLGDGYVEALWKAYPKMPQSADLVMFWWEKAALAARAFDAKKGKGTRRFGLITTNSLRQTFNRRVVEPHLNDPKKPLSLLFAIPDHPWVDATLGAAVRIAMTVGAAGNRQGRLLSVVTESREQSEADGRAVTFDMQVGKIFANLQIGADVAGAKPLKANEGIANRGAFLIGMGFLGTKEELTSLSQGTDAIQKRVVRPFVGGTDLVQRNRQHWVVDFWGLDEKRVQSVYPALFQKILDEVKPARDQNNMKWRRENWWVFGDPARGYRAATAELNHMIVTSRTAKHRIFQTASPDFMPESEVVTFGLEKTFYISVLSSKIHVIWSLAAGSRLGMGNDPRYNSSLCFDPFPFPDLTEPQKTRLRELGEELDAHRKRQQAAHPTLTLTQMYNVLEKLRAGDRIEGKDREIYDHGLIAILRDLHDQIDAEVAAAYGWPADLTDEEILFRLVALNNERAAEEAQGHIRWLRPDYQNPEGRMAAAKDSQTAMDMGVVETAQKEPWPKTLPDQIAAVREALETAGEATPEQIARRFLRARTTSVQPLLESLAALGQATVLEDGRYAA